MRSRPGAQEGEDLLKTCLISLTLRGSAEGSCDRRTLGGRGSWVGNKWSKRALLIETGSVAPGREGNLRVFPGVTNS